jgi:broad specificity phosphatase PhoE
MKLIIVRHGETIENKEGIIQGQTLGTLSDVGKKQAKRLGEALKDKKIDFIYSSDLERTKETLRSILKYHPDTPVIYDPALRERSFGEFEGRNFEEVNKELAPGNLITSKPSKGETLKDIRVRVEKFLKKIFESHQDSDVVLLCTHGGWKHAFYRLIKDMPVNKYMKGLDFQNASISTVNINPDLSHRFLHLNRTRHL